MFFSGKISHAAILFLQRQGIDYEGIYHLTDLQEEFLNDPSCWLEARAVERFLSSLDKEYSKHFDGEDLLSKIGHASHELKSWGVLDSVLRMMRQPQDIYLHPQRFLSYFLSPEPLVQNIYAAEESMRCHLPLNIDEYPCVGQYLKAALEDLPVFMGRPMARVTWTGIELNVEWSQEQTSLLSDHEQKNQQLDPALVSSLMSNIELAQRELELKNKELLEHKEKVSQLENQLSGLQVQLKEQEQNVGLPMLVSDKLLGTLSDVQSQMVRLNDYFFRAHQVITLLVGKNYMTPQVKEAMRRTDWEFVKTEFPNVVQKGIQRVKEVKSVVQEAASASLKIEPVREGSDRAETDLNEFLDMVVQKVLHKTEKQVHLDRMMFYDRPLSLHRSSLEQALENILISSVGSLQSEGKLRLVTRPRGVRAEIEISDTGHGWSSTDIKEHTRLGAAQNLLRSQNANLNIMSRLGDGTTFVIDLPG